MSDTVIETRNLTKRYGAATAVDDKFVEKKKSICYPGKRR